MQVFLRNSGPFGSPNGGRVRWLVDGWYTGETHTEPCPVCQGDQLAGYLAANSGLSGADQSVSLEDFRTSGAYKDKAQALDTARALLGMNHEPSGFVTFIGDYGVGKSHLLKGLANGFRQIGVVARYSTMADALAQIREKFGEPNGSREVEAVIEDYRRARVLCLDEIDRVNLTGWARETVFRLFDARWQESGKLLTVMASNRAPKDLPEDLQYLASRINGGVVCNVPGPDVRAVQGAKATKRMQEEVG